VRPGASFRYLGEVAKLACEFVAAGRVLPALVAEQGRHAARWRPVLAPGDAQRLSCLARAMPPVCRAEAEVRGQAPARRRPDGQVGPGRGLDGRPSLVLLEAALEAFIDAIVRQALAADGLLLPPRRERRSAGRRAAEAWLAALTAPDPVVDAAPAELAKLRRILDEWARPASPAVGAVRTCFRLAPPDGGRALREPGAPEGAPGSVWRLELLL
jgi:hypothetical protein